MSTPADQPDRRFDPVKVVRGWWDIQPVVIPALALVLSFAVGAVLMLIVGNNPLEAYWALLRGMFGSPTKVAGSLARSVPFVGSALALAFAIRAGLFNIGAQGQLLVGGITAAWVGTWSWMFDVPSIIAVPVIVFAGFLGGAMWGAIPGVLRAKTGAHEVISTIMLNSIALFGTTWLINSTDPLLLKDPTASSARTKPISPTAELTQLVASNPPLTAAIFIAVAMAIVVWWVLRRTTFGFSTITVGANPYAAHYAGISVNGIIMLAMTLSGGFAGIAAAGEIAGTTHSFQPGTFAAHGVRRDRHRLAGARPSDRHPRLVVPLGCAARRGSDDAAGRRGVDRRRADHPGDGPALRRRRRDRALRVPSQERPPPRCRPRHRGA